MKEMNYTAIRFASVIALLIMFAFAGNSQTLIPEVFSASTLEGQMNYLQERTRIYDNYRAIREDMFQKIKGNALDSLSKAKKEINGLNNVTLKLTGTIDSLNNSLEGTKNKLEEITKTKNSISILGLEINKTAYNTLMWTLIAGLLSILAVGFLLSKRNRVITLHTKKEFEELKTEFDAYRKTSREDREKMSMAHFNELKKLKGG